MLKDEREPKMAAHMWDGVSRDGGAVAMQISTQPFLHTLVFAPARTAQNWIYPTADFHALGSPSGLAPGQMLGP